jgi:hypothetical protein
MQLDFLAMMSPSAPRNKFRLPPKFAAILVWTLYLLLFGWIMWKGFARGWSAIAWSDLGSFMFLIAVNWFCFGSNDRFARKISSLPQKERERRLAIMTPEERELVLQWMNDHPAIK